MTRSAKRTDDLGRAFAGSQLQVQIYVARRQAELSSAVAAVIQRPGLEEHLRWVAPSEEQRFSEPNDGRFMEVLGLGEHKRKLREFWPTGGPHWDALAVVSAGDAPTVIILAEGKSYPSEVHGPGSLATADSSKQLISRSLEEARAWFHAEDTPEWKGTLYQYANRLAHVFFFHREFGISTWLVNLCFADDTTTTPTTETEWQAALPSFKKRLGFANGKIPWVADLVLPARDRVELSGNDAASNAIHRTAGRRRFLNAT